jgi:rod shape-determining protein MreB
LLHSYVSQFRRIFPIPYLAIDLGTANTRIYALGKGLIAENPSVVQREPGEARLPGRTGGGRSEEDAYVLPVRSGVVIDVDAAVALLQPLIRRARRFGLLRPRGIVCLPTGARQSERDALVEATRRCGVSVLAVAPEPLAAALGGGLSVDSAYAQMLVDIGGGVTDIAVIRSGRIIHSKAIRTACGDLQAAIINEVAEGHGVQLPPREAERLVREAGARPESTAACCHIARGIGAGGKSAIVRLDHAELRGILDPVFDTIVRGIFDFLRDLPPAAAAEVIEDCIWLTGGGACLRGMAERVAEVTTLEVRLVRDPMHAVINGAARMLSAAALA